MGRNYWTKHELTHDIEGLASWVQWHPRRGMVFCGHHLMRGAQSPYGMDAEYEYWLRLDRHETRALARAVGVSWLWQLTKTLQQRSTEIMLAGEVQWARSHLGEAAGRFENRLHPLN